MNVIKFSHHYIKMPRHPVDEEETELLQVFKSDFSELSTDFISHDTMYYKNGKNFDEAVEFYELPPRGPCLVLLLYSHDEDHVNTCLWTTVRRWTKEKEKYYVGKQGEHFRVIIDAEPPVSKPTNSRNRNFKNPSNQDSKLPKSEIPVSEKSNFPVSEKSNFPVSEKSNFPVSEKIKLSISEISVSEKSKLRKARKSEDHNSEISQFQNSKISEE